MAMLVGLTPCPLAHFHESKAVSGLQTDDGSNQEARFANFKMDDVKVFLMSRTACKPFWSTSTSWKQPYSQDNFELRLAPHCHTVHFIVQGSRCLPSLGEDFTGWGDSHAKLKIKEVR